MQTNPYMGLSVWNLTTDNYDHAELDINWDKIDAHDHTTGKGKKIPIGGLEDGSVTGTQLAANSVTTNHIVNGTILGVDLADGILGANHFSSTLLDKLVPLGVVIAWYRPTTGTAVPTGWSICDGASLTAGNHGWGGITVALPDLRNRFVLGAATSGTGTGAGTPPAESLNSGMVYGGAHSRTFNHSHTVPAHTHVVDAHSHTVSAHTHTISADGAHMHQIHSRPNAFVGGLTIRDEDNNPHSNTLQSLYVSGYDPAIDAGIDPTGSHNHGAGTGSTSPATNTAAPNTSSVAVTTDGTGVGGDLRPGFCGLLYIIKVKHPS